jgi:hypothetical protein
MLQFLEVESSSSVAPVYERRRRYQVGMLRRAVASLARRPGSVTSGRPHNIRLDPTAGPETGSAAGQPER